MWCVIGSQCGSIHICKQNCALVIASPKTHFNARCKQGHILVKMISIFLPCLRFVFVLLWCGSSSNQQWYRNPQSLHLFGHIDHLIQRGGNQARQTDDICRNKANRLLLTYCKNMNSITEATIIQIIWIGHNSDWWQQGKLLDSEVNRRLCRLVGLVSELRGT